MYIILKRSIIKILCKVQHKHTLFYWSYCKVVVSTFISVHFASDRLPLDEPVLTLMYVFRLVILTYNVWAYDVWGYPNTQDVKLMNVLLHSHC